jgi:hypothetical protein
LCIRMHRAGAIGKVFAGTVGSNSPGRR